MIFKIRHHLRYRYAAPAVLGPQSIRLRPREDGGQRLLDHLLQIDPQPSLRSACLDEHGNVAEHAWFVGQTELLELQAESTVETLRQNPFDFVIDADYTSLPWGRRIEGGRPGAVAALLGPVEAEAAELAAALRVESGNDALSFLMRLNRWINEKITYEVRPEGAALAAGETLGRARGSCRDLAVLFCAAARSEGVPARFVSGYHEGDPHMRIKELHAWAEVFLPGAGWRGFDPSIGLACSDRHIALAASPDPAGAAPLWGRFGSTTAESKLETEVLFL
jgi:transglutaminase-like putative cysteine protease